MRLLLNGHSTAIREHLQAALRALDAGRDIVWAVEPDDPDRVPFEIRFLADDTECVASGPLYAEED
jgi:hypothetical protein